MSNKSTKTTKVSKGTKSQQKFLNAAEILFSENGYEGTKIRAIADHSGVNLGALHHYWGNKEGLFTAVCKRRLEAMNKERMLRFDALEEAAQKKKSKAIKIRDLLKASIEPTFFLNDLNAKEQAIFQKLYGRVMTEPSPVVGKVMRGIFSPVSKRFFKLLKELCPHLNEDEFYWRAMCLFGSFLYAPAYSERMTYYAHSKFDVDNTELGIAEIVAFLAAGMLAPPSSRKKQK